MDKGNDLININTKKYDLILYWVDLVNQMGDSHA